MCAAGRELCACGGCELLLEARVLLAQPLSLGAQLQTQATVGITEYDPTFIRYSAELVWLWVSLGIVPTVSTSLCICLMACSCCPSPLRVTHKAASSFRNMRP